MQRSLDCWDLQNGQRYRICKCTHTIFKTHRIISLHPSRQDNARLLQERAVAYINADSAIEGENAFLLKKWLSARLFLVLFVCVNVFLKSRYVHSEGWLHSITAYFGVWHHEAGGQILTTPDLSIWCLSKHLLLSTLRSSVFMFWSRYPVQKKEKREYLCIRAGIRGTTGQMTVMHPGRKLQS